ncbi:unnamed protein product [Rotaria sordida]|uniref:G-protein coupled receptors family 1 profile domain-containing protein n=1 Tax=Rotaria sordida TaxID=392033 RepID=A0A819Q1W0_9BILA|nr:unnamed protein product [Rotaria sordida]CAF4027638.1 unnamed protein product [Rotaria sordida]
MFASLTDIGIQLTRIITLVIIFIGVVGNWLNIAILTRRTLYQNACSRYFLVVAINNLFYSGVVLVYRLLNTAYNINSSDNSIFLCKISNYIIYTSSFIAPYFIICASIDRYCASSTNAQMRKFSSV